MIKLLAVVLLTTTCLTGQAVPICSAVSEEDAKSILGPSAKRTKDPGGCGWEAAGNKKHLMEVARIAVPSMFETARAASAKEGTTQPENGLGGTAFSTIPSKYQGGRAAIYLLKGQAVLVVDIDGFAAGGAVEQLPRVRDLVRKLAAKL